MGTTYGIYPWVALVMGNLMGRRFWVGCGWFFFGVGPGGKEEAPGYVSSVGFRWTTSAFEQPHFLCCILYIDQWGFHYFMFQTISDGDPRVSRSWSDTYVVEVSTTDDLFHTLKTMWGPVPLRSTTDSTEQLIWCLIHMWSMLHVISVICYLTRICICRSYYCEMVVGPRAQVYTLLEVWGGWELGAPCLACSFACA